MPRSSDNRKFGWKEPGLVRVLTGADPVEVKRALDSLGIDTTVFLDELINLRKQHQLFRSRLNTMNNIESLIGNELIAQLNHHHRGSNLVQNARNLHSNYLLQANFLEQLDTAHEIALSVLIIKAEVGIA